jgi:hypothetical protein
VIIQQSRSDLCNLLIFRKEVNPLQNHAYLTPLDFGRLTTKPLQNKLVIPVEVPALEGRAGRELQPIQQNKRIPGRMDAESKLPIAPTWALPAPNSNRR